MIQYTKAYIEALLGKFMAGTSTLEEEDILSQYFAQSQIPAEWEQYRLLFAELEAMKPTEKPKRRWMGWVAAAAIALGMIYLTIPSSETPATDSDALVAEADTTTIQQAEKSTIDLTPDTMPRHEENAQPVPAKKRSMRKQVPTLHDYDKAYALMAQMEEEKRNIDWQLEQYEQETIDAQLAAYGYIPVIQEDGTIIYINEQTNYIAYEE
ncbi:MAG: hypothetical protein IJV20_08075 [Prevotella sp.]|nr:hypothetical protein [Prevotella sp.]